MSLFHKSVNERLAKHIDELKALGLLPAKWKWKKPQIQRLEEVSGALISDLGAIHIDIHQASLDLKKQQNQASNDLSDALAYNKELAIQQSYRTILDKDDPSQMLVMPLFALRRDLQAMLKQRDLTESMQGHEARIVNGLIEQITRIFSENSLYSETDAANRTKRIEAIIAELQNIFQKKYPDRAGLFEISYVQEPKIKHGSSSVPAFKFILTRIKTRKAYLIFVLLFLLQI